MGASYLQAEEDLALHLQSFIQEGLKVASPVSLLGQAACVLAQAGLSFHQLISQLPVAGMGMCCLVPLQPALLLLHQTKMTCGRSGEPRWRADWRERQGKGGGLNGLWVLKFVLVMRLLYRAVRT